ncbi:hypothetical protein HMSSN139_37250 [Paenibacillus sp. HMSSN-139]|nr:hypothetical protein HMSSN139_37250 [Paenibacillus sp. HMSSN-139]
MSAKPKKWQKQLAGTHKIKVPFTYETEASGIGLEDFHARVWYSKSVPIPKEAAGKRVILHFQAVDYIAKVWVNGESGGRTSGGLCRIFPRYHAIPGLRCG